MDANGNNNGRGNWGSRLAFIMAAAGSAIGLGNIWRFPVVTAEGGGGAFVFVYLICIVLVALPVMLAEMVVGRAGERNPVGAFKHLAPKTLWPAFGYLGVLTGLIILSFYSVIAGWTVYYFVKTLSGTFTGEFDTEAIFDDMRTDVGIEFLFHAIFMVATIVVVAVGIRKGIERAIKILMPTFLLLLFILMLRSLTLPGAGEGLAFYLTPNFSEIDGATVMTALAQAFFSLSLGMGAIITYGSYLHKREDLPISATCVAGADTLIALLAGLVIFPAMFFAAIEPGAAGPGLIFVVMPQIFVEMPGAPWGGILFGAAFFFLLAVAALTSAISLLEVVVAYLVDEKKFSRKAAAWSVGGLAFALGLPSALSAGAFPNLGLFGMTLIDLLSGPFMNLSLTVGALGLCLFVGWKWGLQHALHEIQKGTPEFRMAAVWGILIRFVAPVAILVILAWNIVGLIT